MKQYTQQPSLLALSPLFIFLGVYLVTSLIADDFYKVPITVAFVISSIAAIAMTRHLGLSERIAHFSGGASDKNILLMIWIFILAGAFAQSAKAMGAIDATVNLTLHILPDNLLLAGIFIAACFISLSVGTSVGTIVALTPVAVGIADKTGVELAYMVAIVVGGAFFGDNLSFISDTTIAATKTQGCEMRDKFKVNSLIVMPAAILLLFYYVFAGMHIHADRSRRMDQGYPLSHRSRNCFSRHKCHARIISGDINFRAYRYTLFRFRFVRLVRCYGSRYHRHGGIDHYHFIGRRYARNDPIQRRDRLHHRQTHPTCQFQTCRRAEYRRFSLSGQSLYGQQHDRCHHHRSYS